MAAESTDLSHLQGLLSPVKRELSSAFPENLKAICHQGVFACLVSLPERYRGGRGFC